MKNSQITILTFSLVLFLTSISAATGLENGFMGNKWGEDISSFNGLVKLYSKNDVTYYSNPGESYTIDDILINDVIFGFYEDSFFAVHIGIDTLETFDRIKAYMKSKYGFPDRKKSNKNSFSTLKWKHQDISIKIKIDDLKGKMKLSFYYGPILRNLKKSKPSEISDTPFRFVPVDKNKRPSMVPFLEF